MLKLITDVKAHEIDILTPYTSESLRICRLGSDLSQLTFPAPDDGWTHEILTMAVDHLIPTALVVEGCDAYLGECWIGSTEV